MPPEQLVDVPVPQVHERFSRSLVYEQGTRFLESLHRRWEAEEAARLALLEEEQMDEEEEEEEVEVSRLLPHFRPRRWCWYVHAGSICPRGWDCTLLHTMSLSFIQTHGSALCWWAWGPRAWPSLGPFLGAPAGSPGQVKYTGGTGSGAWRPLTPSWVPVVWCGSTTNHGSRGGGSACAYFRGSDRGMPVPQIMPVRGGRQLSLRTSTGAVLGQGC